MSHGICLQALKNIENCADISSSIEISYLYEFNPSLLLGNRGVCLQQFYRQQNPATYGFFQEAKQCLELALNSNAPTKRKIYYLNDLASAYARQGEIEIACAYAAQSVPMIVHIGIESIYNSFTD